MSKFTGNIGYVTTEQTAHGVYREVAHEHHYRGDLLRNSRRVFDAGEVNSSITVSNQVSIVADPYARDHFHEMRYVVLRNSKWTITHVDVQYPRLILTIGEIYNGPTPS